MKSIFAGATVGAAGEMTQIASIDLQNTLQKQQQFVQTMSNVMKQTDDTTSSIISNLK